jgi:hypothetical protein
MRTERKDRKFDYLLNVEEALDVMLADERLESYSTWFKSMGILYELSIERDIWNPNKLVVLCEEETNLLNVEGHTEIIYFKDAFN